MSFTMLDYRQYLLSSRITYRIAYTLTNLTNRLQKRSHDIINRYLKGEELVPRSLFERGRLLLEPDPEACPIL